MWKRKPKVNVGRSPIDWQAELQRHDRWLRTIVFSRVGDRHAVDDVMQEVALAAVRSSAPPKNPEKIAPWLYRVAIRQALMYRRTCGRRRKLTEKYVAASCRLDHDVSHPQPLQWLMAEERRKLVRVAMGRLPRRDAEILALKYTEDWSYREIAENLGISQSAVEARLFRARGRLRAQLESLENAEQRVEGSKVSSAELVVSGGSY